MERVAASPECEDLLRTLHPRLVGGLTLHCGDPALAEELAQETLARVWSRWHEVRAHPAPQAWAWRVALNLSTSWFRRRAAERRANAKVGPPPAEAPTADAADRLAVRAAVAGLPARQRAVLVLRYFDDLSVAEAATALGCAKGTVKSLTHQAIAALRERLDVTIDIADEEVGNHA
jgi:RNA polymerase sigma-70 factor (sigma-E family)